jgi:hypothetical protein
MTLSTGPNGLIAASFGRTRDCKEAAVELVPGLSAPPASHGTDNHRKGGDKFGEIAFRAHRVADQTNRDVFHTWPSDAA